MESPLENVVIITIWFFVHFHRIPGSDSSGSADLPPSIAFYYLQATQHSNKHVNNARMRQTWSPDHPSHG